MSQEHHQGHNEEKGSPSRQSVPPSPGLEELYQDLTDAQKEQLRKFRMGYNLFETLFLTGRVPTDEEASLLYFGIEGAFSLMTQKQEQSALGLVAYERDSTLIKHQEYLLDNGKVYKQPGVKLERMDPKDYQKLLKPPIASVKKQKRVSRKIKQDPPQENPVKRDPEYQRLEGRIKRLSQETTKLFDRGESDTDRCKALRTEIRLLREEQKQMRHRWLTSKSSSSHSGEHSQ